MWVRKRERSEREIRERDGSERFKQLALGEHLLLAYLFMDED